MKNESILAFRNKLKLLYLKDVFERNTDVNHGLSHKELKELMEAVGIDINDRTLRDDITALQDYMQDVDMELTDNIKYEEGKEKAHPIRYKISKRLFTPTEVKLLMESVRGIHSLSNEQTEILLGKLSTLCSLAEAAQIRNEFAVNGGFKAYWHNKKHDVLLENIELIDQAIRENRRIRFKYFWYKVTLEPTYPRDPKHRHVISPLVRVYENGFYYLVGLDEDGYFRHFRLDRMTDLSITLKKRSQRQGLDKIDWIKYVNSHFGMETKVLFKRKRTTPTLNINSFYYKSYEVKMRFTRDLVGAVMDQFGQDVWLHREDKGHFVATFTAQYNPQFVAWVLGFGSKVRILSPDFMYKDIWRYAHYTGEWHKIRDEDE